jgi:hypothetical protein
MIYLEEFTKDDWGGYLTRWHCKPPAKGVNFIVLRDNWDDDDVRDIFEIRVVIPSGSEHR